MGLRASASLAAREQFAGYDAFGFVPARGRITVLDIDTTDELILRAALSRHGETPVLIRTASGKYHAWYQHSGERRMIRPWGPELPIDVLGAGGYVVAPPSVYPGKGVYEFVSGSLDDVASLPRMRGLDDLKARPVPEQPEPATASPRNAIREGERNKTVWRACMRHAVSCDNLQELCSFAMRLNAQCFPPLSDVEILQIAESAWRYTERGLNAFSGDAVVAIRKDDVNKLDPDSTWLLAHLNLNHWARECFVLPKSYAKAIGWSPQRLRKATKRIEAAKIIHRTARGGNHAGDCATYAWNSRR
jgi:hypothetical protein